MLRQARNTQPRGLDLLAAGGAAVGSDGGARGAREVGDVLGHGVLGADGARVDTVGLSGLGEGVVARVEVLALLEVFGEVVGAGGELAVEAEEALFLGGEGLWVCLLAGCSGVTAGEGGCGGRAGSAGRRCCVVLRGCVNERARKRGKTYLDVDLVLLVRIHHRGDRRYNPLEKKVGSVASAKKTLLRLKFALEERGLFKRLSKLWASVRRKWSCKRLGKVWRIRLLKLGGSARGDSEPRTSRCGGPVTKEGVGWVGKASGGSELEVVRGRTGRRIPFMAGWERLISFCGGGNEALGHAWLLRAGMKFGGFFAY